MGYDLHITRKVEWSDAGGPPITSAEWRTLVNSDSDLRLDEGDATGIGSAEIVSASFEGELGVFNWENGEIWTKNPELEAIKKAVQIAHALGAKAQGDDGEIYGPNGEPLPEEPVAQSAPVRPGIFSRIMQWFRHRGTVKKLQQASPSFRVGDRVRDTWGSIATVSEVDAKAMYGVGRVRIRYDDGRERTVALVASGLEIVKE